jgi:hypothetical protein
LRRRARRSAPPRGAEPTAADPAAIDARYGLEPVFEPGADASGDLGGFVDVDCPYCGERYVTPIDLTGGSASCIEDCQVCCRPIELEITVADDGTLASLVVRRLD